MKYTIFNDYVSVELNDLGANLESIKDRNGKERLWQGDSRYWDGKSLTIFPFVARLTGGYYYMDGELHKMGIHGFSSSCTFEMVHKSSEKIEFLLKENENTYEAYPRRFEFRVLYELERETIRVRYTVSNMDDKIMYFALGGHPGFNVPLNPGESFDDYYLEFDFPKDIRRVGFTESLFITGNDEPFSLEKGTRLGLNHQLFDDDAIVLKNSGHRVSLKSRINDNNIIIEYPQMNYLGLWHAPKTEAPYICIEPWSSLPAVQDVITVFEEDDNLISLNPGTSYTNEWTITVC